MHVKTRTIVPETYLSTSARYCPQKEGAKDRDRHLRLVRWLGCRGEGLVVG